VLTYLLTHTTADANSRLWLCRGVAATLLIALFGWLLAQLLGSVDLALALKTNETLLVRGGCYTSAGFPDPRLACVWVWVRPSAL
jgi:ABC-type amino acid transport system permease subunit